MIVEFSVKSSPELASDDISTAVADRTLRGRLSCTGPRRVTEQPGNDVAEFPYQILKCLLRWWVFVLQCFIDIGIFLVELVNKAYRDPLKEFDLANKIAVLGMREGWCVDYVCATYRRWFQEGLEAGSEPNLSDSLTEIGQDPKRVIQLVESDQVTKSYLEQTDSAREKGIFGSPTCVVDGELFWGDDRIEDAVWWLKNR